MFGRFSTLSLVSFCQLANAARRNTLEDSILSTSSTAADSIREFVIDQGHSAATALRVIDDLTSAYGDFSDMVEEDEDEVRFLVNQVLYDQNRTDMLTSGQISSMLQISDMEEDDAPGIKGRLLSSMLEKSELEDFVGPFRRTDCKPYTHLALRPPPGLNPEQCATLCRQNSACVAFSTFTNRKGILYCELFSKCELGEGALDIYIRNVEGITPTHLPGKTYDKQNFFVIGDWGSESCIPTRAASMHYMRNGPKAGTLKWVIDDMAQKNVGRAMGHLGKYQKPFAVVNAGDNFYWGGIEHPIRGGKGIFDKAWQVAFEEVYTDDSIQVPWLNILGNHDYGGNGCFGDIAAQFDYTFKDMLGNGRWKLPGAFYNHRAELPGDISMEFFMLDTNIEDHIGGRHGGICDQKLCKGGMMKTIKHDSCIRLFNDMWKEQQDWFRKVIAASTADWKIIVMHHKPHSFFGQTLMKIANAHGANLVIASHTHEMAFYEQKNPAWLVAGAGGGAQAAPGCGDATFCSAKYGFADVEATPEKLHIRIFHFDGSKGYEGYVCKNGQMC